MTLAQKTKSDLIKHDNTELEVIVTIVKDEGAIEKELDSLLLERQKWEKIQYYEKWEHSFTQY